MQPQKTEIETPVTPVRERPAPAPAPEKQESPLERVLADIRADARQDPEQYLKDTIVPEGGE